MNIPTLEALREQRASLVAEVNEMRATAETETRDLNDDELTDFLRASLGAAFVNCRDGAAWYVAAPPGPLHTTPPPPSAIHQRKREHATQEVFEAILGKVVVLDC